MVLANGAKLLRRICQTGEVRDSRGFVSLVICKRPFQIFVAVEEPGDCERTSIT